LLALAEEGDEVIYPDPGFPIYQSVINFVGAKPVPLPLREELGFRFDMDELRAKVNSHTKMLIINSPHNPTGGVLSGDDLKAIADLAKDSGFMILSDEVYSRIIYEGKHASIASLPGMKELTIILEGYSKTYAMTGWRLGYGVMPVELAGQISRLMTNSNSCTAAFTQWAGIEALRGPQDASEAMVEAFRERRDAVVAGLNGIPGIRCLLPKGAFYVFPNVEGVGMGGDRFADHLLNEAGVALLSGTAFGACGEGFLRISYANSMENLKRAVARISDAVGRIG
jgi:aspartate/methionine/tyrosine aminotransferase